MDLFNLEPDTSVKKPKRSQPIHIKIKDRQPSFGVVADLKNKDLVSKAELDYERRVSQSREEYTGPYEKRAVAKLARAVLKRLHNDLFAIDTLLTNDPHLDEAEALQIRSIRYVIRRDRDLKYWIEMSAIDGESDQYIDSEMIIDRYIKALEDKNLVKRVGDSYVILHEQLLGGIWGDDEARRRVGAETVEEISVD